HPRHLHSFPTRRSSDLDGPPLTSYLFTELSASITGTGTSLDLQFTCFANAAGTEELAIDNFRLFTTPTCTLPTITGNPPNRSIRSEEHTSELQSRENLV